MNSKLFYQSLIKKEPRDSEANRRRQNRSISTEEWNISASYQTKDGREVQQLLLPKKCRKQVLEFRT